MEQNITDPRNGCTSASSADADSRCAGRFQAQKGKPHKDSEFSIHGTLIHAALSKQDPTGLNTEQVDTYDACNTIEQKVLVKYFGPEVEGLKPNPVREKRFWIRWADGLAHSAQIDSVHRKGTKALIVEYKTLSSDIPQSPKNLQLRDQVCVFDVESPLLTEIAVCVIQPLATHDPELCVYQRADIMRAREQLYARVAASNKPDAVRTPGEVQCKYCKAVTTCKEYNKWAGSMVSAKTQMDAVYDIMDLAISEWTPAMRVVFLERLPAAQKWLDECKDAMKKLLAADPEAIPGYELKPGARREIITNPQGVFDRFSASGGTLEQFMDCISVAKTKLKEKLSAVAKTKGKKLDEQMKELTAGMVEFKENEASIKRKE